MRLPHPASRKQTLDTRRDRCGYHRLPQSKPNAKPTPRRHKSTQASLAKNKPRKLRTAVANQLLFLAPPASKSLLHNTCPKLKKKTSAKILEWFRQRRRRPPSFAARRRLPTQGKRGARAALDTGPAVGAVGATTAHHLSCIDPTTKAARGQRYPRPCPSSGSGCGVGG